MFTGIGGLVYEIKGDYDLALADYNRVIDLNPALADAHYNRGVVYHRKGDYNRAIEDYTTAIELQSNLAEAYCNRGEVVVTFERMGES